MIAAHGLTLDEGSRAATLYRGAIPVVGATLAIAVLVGVFAAACAKICTWLDLRSGLGMKREPFGVRTWITFIGLIPDFTIPLLFAFAWLFLLRGRTAVAV